MNTKPSLRTLALLALLLSTLIHPLSTHAQGTAFTYQGQLYAGTNLASGKYDFQFALSNAPSGGMHIGGTLTNLGVGVTNGLFITTLDFGPVFTGQSNWLAIAVRTNGGSGFTPLSPLQAITPTPYAVYAESANATNLVGTVPSANLTNVALLSGGNTFAGAQTINNSSDNNVLNLIDTRTGSTGSGAQLNLGDDYSGSLENASLGSIGNGGGFTWRTGALELRPVSRVNIYKGLDVTAAGNVALTVIGSSGNVGIGTTTPGTTLQVNGTVTANNFSGNGSGLTNLAGASVSGVALLSGGNNFTGGSNTFAGSVGIGTSTPNSPLAVYGNIFMGKERNNTVFNQIGDTIYLGAEQKYLGNTLLTAVGGSTDWINLMANPISAGIMFGTSGSSTSNPHSNITALVVIKPNGNVGIGTNNPSAPLFVVGNPTGNTPSSEGVIVGVQNGTNVNGAAVVGLSLVPGGNGIIGEADVAGGGGIPIGVIADSSAAGGIGLEANALGANSFAAQFNGTCYFSGNVGIGTSTPTKGALEIDSTANGQPFYDTVGYLDTTGAGVGGIEAGVPSSIWASGDLFANACYAFSDERIKNIQGHSDGAADLKTLLGIQITDYTYIDTIAKGNRPNKKVIAQQVEKVFPQAVSQSTDEVPDIYKRAPIQDGWVQLATDLKVGERVKLIGDKEKGIYPVLEVRDGAFRTDFKPKTDKVFVYGREVNDFRTVDYDAISMLNVSATQELARKVAAQESELTELRGELDKLRAQKASLASTVSELKTRDDAREDRLARMESALEKVSAHGAYASVK